MNKLNPLAYSGAQAREIVKKRKAAGLEDISEMRRAAADPVKLYNGARPKPQQMLRKLK